MIFAKLDAVGLSQEFVEGVRLLSVAGAAEQADVLCCRRPTLREGDDVVELDLVVRDVLVANPAMLVVTANDLEHQGSREGTTFRTPFGSFRCAALRPENWADVAPDATLDLGPVELRVEQPLRRAEILKTIGILEQLIG